MLGEKQEGNHLELKDNVPNPGSDAAINLGCSCPVLDNAHGKGYFGGTGFIISEGCIIHDTHSIHNKKKEEGV